MSHPPWNAGFVRQSGKLHPRQPDESGVPVAMSELRPFCAIKKQSVFTGTGGSIIGSLIMSLNRGGLHRRYVSLTTF
jgi:hypothetical protein